MLPVLRCAAEKKLERRGPAHYVVAEALRVRIQAC